MKSHTRIVHPSQREAELSIARCTCDDDVVAHGCPLHYPQIYAAWHSKHRA